MIFRVSILPHFLLLYHLKEALQFVNNVKAKTLDTLINHKDFVARIWNLCIDLKTEKEKGQILNISLWMSSTIW